jgi:hypothetical protein
MPLASIILFMVAMLIHSTPACSQGALYGGAQQFSLIFGERGISFGFSMTNGIRFKRFFTGIGLDAQFRGPYFHDKAPFNTSAIFGDGRYYLNTKKNFFCKLNGGVNLINPRTGRVDWIRQKNRAGYYAAAGAGFKARIGKEIFYSFDVSYVLRQTRYDYAYREYRSGSWTENKIDFRRSAIQVNMGIEIF